MFDVLIYLFENYIDGQLELTPNQESVKSMLMEAGFSYAEIDKAFVWLEALAQIRESSAQEGRPTAHSTRIYGAQEMARLDVDCRGFLVFLEQAGVLNPTSRELVIDRVMALETEEIDLAQLKWVILMVLFNQPGQEAAYAWLEDLVFEEASGSLH